MPTELSHRPLTVAAVGRCDRCPAAARYQAVLSAGALLFCGHHAREHRARLLEIGVRLSPVPDTPTGPNQEKGPPR
jgi:hypothetical protein